MANIVVTGSTSESQTEQLRTLVVVGCGRRFRSAVLPMLQKLPTRIVALIDPVKAAYSSLITELGQEAPPLAASTFTTNVVSITNPDAVIITSPSGLHFEQAAIALAAGIKTFVEKPLACTALHAHELKLAANDRLTVSDQRIHRKDIVLAKELIQSQRLGEIREVNYDDAIRPAPSFSTSWRNDPQMAGGGVLFDLGYHTINTLQWLLNLDRTAMDLTTAVLHFREFNVDQHAVVNWHYNNISISMRIALVERNPRELLRIIGSKATLTIWRERGAEPKSMVRFTDAGASSPVNSRGFGLVRRA